MPRKTKPSPAKSSNHAWLGIFFIFFTVFGVVYATRAPVGSPVAYLPLPPPLGGSNVRSSGYIQDLAGYTCDKFGKCCDIAGKCFQVTCDTLGKCCDAIGNCFQVICDALGKCTPQNAINMVCDVFGNCCDTLGNCMPSLPPSGPYCYSNTDCTRQDKCSFCASDNTCTPITCMSPKFRNEDCACVCPKRNCEADGMIQDSKTCECKPPDCKTNADCQRNASGGPTHSDPATNNCNYCVGGVCKFRDCGGKGCLPSGNSLPQCIGASTSSQKGNSSSVRPACGRDVDCKSSCEKCVNFQCVPIKCKDNTYCAEISYNSSSSLAYGQCVECTEAWHCNKNSPDGSCNICVSNKCQQPQFCNTGKPNIGFGYNKGSTPDSGTTNGTTGQTQSLGNTGTTGAGVPSQGTTGNMSPAIPNGGQNTPSNVQGTGQTPLASGPISFPDVPGATRLSNALFLLTSRGIVRGYSDGKFHPEASVTRAEAAAILERFIGLRIDTLPTTVSVAVDVPQGAWFTGVMALAKEIGIMKGYDDGSMRPMNAVTRAEYLEMASTALQLPKNTTHSFVDVQQGAWYEGSASIAARYALETGSFFKPGEALTRAEVAEYTAALLMQLGE